MSDKPKEIWAYPDEENGWSSAGRWNVEFAWHDEEELYIHADEVDRLKSEVERLEKRWKRYRATLGCVVEDCAGLAKNLEKAMAAMEEVLERSTKSYTAKNGKVCTIESDDGEACEIVHSDAMFGLRAALSDILKGETDDTPE